ncbi:MAG: transcriptional regulator [Lachnospiraceae bacterium]|nr:transcriptional regulator [Lachnospiraceae bacterium]
MSFMKEIITKNIPIWDQCAATPFLKELQTGVLSIEKFKSYIIQDSIYLKNYARVYGKMIYCATTLTDMQQYYSALSFVTDTESVTRLYYLKQFGITDDDIEYIEPLPENKKYLDFLLAIAEQGSAVEMLMAVLPCMLSYSYIFRKIRKMPETVSSKYDALIQDYAEDVYYESCKNLYYFAATKYNCLSEKEREKSSTIFEKASFLELDFWKMAYGG